MRRIFAWSPFCLQTLGEPRQAGQRFKPVSWWSAVCHTDGIRTTLDIDDDLMDTLLARLPGRSKTDAIEHAIGSFLSADAVERLASLAGTLEIEDLSTQLRRVDRST